MTTATPPPTTVEPRNGFAITALVLGIVGILFGLIPLTGFIAFILGATGLVFALSNRGRIKRGRSDAKKMTIFGGVLSAIALALGIWGMIILFTAVDQFGEDMEDIGNDLDSYSQCIDDADTAAQMDACE